MSYDPVYNELATVDDTTYLVQDGPLFDDPMIRSIDELLECERSNVNKMLGKNQGGGQ